MAVFTNPGLTVELIKSLDNDNDDYDDDDGDGNGLPEGRRGTSLLSGLQTNKVCHHLTSSLAKLVLP